MKKSNFRRFLLLWVGQLISAIGGALASFGLGVYIFQKTAPFLSLYLLGYYKFPVIIKFTMFVLANGKYVFCWLIMSCFYWLL